MLKRLLHNRIAVGTIGVVLLVALIGIFAPVVAPNDPYETNILNKFAEYSLEYPLGTDQLGRCVLSRMIYGIRPTLGLALLTMLGTIGLGALLGIMAGYFRGAVEEVIMRVVDVMLSFPREEVSAYVGLHPDYLNRLFKKETGVSLKEYIADVKVHMACELLEQTDFLVGEIGEMVGYVNFSSFTTFFKNRTGLTPVAWRKEHSK